MHYINRKRDTYYIFEGRTKTGKPKYFASRKESSEAGSRVESLPPGHQIFEHPSSAVVTVRKVDSTQILDAEMQLVQRLADRLINGRSRIDCSGKTITIFVSDGGFGLTAMLRFKLADLDKRNYESQRYCFRGRIDDWIGIGYSGNLEKICNELFPKLNDEETWFDIF